MVQSFLFVQHSFNPLFRIGFSRIFSIFFFPFHCLEGKKSRKAKRCLGRLSHDHSGRTEISIKVIARIVLNFAILFIILLLSMTQIVPVWHMATVFQPDVFLWLKIVAVLLGLNGSMEIIRLVRSIQHEKTSKLNHWK